MREETKTEIIAVAVTIIIFVGLFGGFLWYVGYMFDETEKERHELIESHIVLHAPFREVVAVSSRFICGGEEGWYFVSIIVTTDEYPDPQWIYDFRYDWNTDTLYYDGNIEGIGVVNES